MTTVQEMCKTRVTLEAIDESAKDMINQVKENLIRVFSPANTDYDPPDVIASLPDCPALAGHKLWCEFDACVYTIRHTSADGDDEELERITDVSYCEGSCMVDVIVEHFIELDLVF